MFMFFNFKHVWVYPRWLESVQIYYIYVLIHNSCKIWCGDIDDESYPDKHRAMIYLVGQSKVLRNFYGATNDEYANPRVLWSHDERYVYCTSQDHTVVNLKYYMIWCVLHRCLKLQCWYPAGVLGSCYPASSWKTCRSHSAYRM